MNIWAKVAGATLLAGTVFVGGLDRLDFVGNGGKVYAEAVNVVRNVISVNGEAEISVSPDIAYLSIGVQTQGKTAASAQKNNAQIMDKVNDLLKTTWGINAKDIKTAQFSVQPNYDYNKQSVNNITGYTVYHTLNVTYRDLPKIGQLLDAVANVGANNMNGIQFAVEHPEKYEEEAIAKALASAQLKASAIAKAANRPLGSLLNVNLESADAPMFYQDMAMSKSAGSAAGKNTAIEPGQIKLHTRLSAQYEMNG